MSEIVLYQKYLQSKFPAKRYSKDRYLQVAAAILSSGKKSITYQQANIICRDLGFQTSVWDPTLDKIWRLGIIIKLRDQTYTISPFLKKISIKIPTFDIYDYRPDINIRQQLQNIQQTLPEHFQKWQPFSDYMAIMYIYEKIFASLKEDADIIAVIEHIRNQLYPISLLNRIRQRWNFFKIQTPISYKTING